ncbi:DUF3667 domain-containing protein [Flagellimonas myxillae]|uniref:DUF3667 domain-containing protein n=1 Tax=Flagellimonas myxillae TaxID=2942214 RepID=UPI00201EC0A1|nr:DUF3667 domain-containing protein [Muricauda myxillae]MCL6265146.1 DUF3667 domain-containing protein [Muricauda myxillae]
MECKNCNNALQPTDRYCNACGAKVIRNRLTLKNVWQDVSFQVFNMDNTFLKTFKKLCSKPEEVILSYISGTRRRYMNPVGYFAIAITLSGIMFFVLRDVYHINLTESSFNNEAAPQLNFIFDFQALLAYMSMPLYALMTWMLFSGTKKFNYTEHLVANAYIIGQASYVQVVTYILFLGLFPIKFDVFNFGFLIFLVIYQFYALARMHQLRFWGTFWRGLVYFVLLIIVMMGIGAVIVIISLMTGLVSIEDLAPK